jgi:hypothetical protein
MLFSEIDTYSNQMIELLRSRFYTPFSKETVYPSNANKVDNPTPPPPKKRVA